jgi:protein SCO1
MQRTHLMSLLALVAVVTASMAAFVVSRSTSPTFHGTDLGPGIPAHEFTLQDTRGEAASLSDFRGRPVLMFFGYTHCPDVCPLTLGKLRLALEQAGERARAVQVLLVTVDPEMDTADRMREYLSNFDPGFVGLTGTRAELEAVTRAYGVYAGEAHPPAPRLIDHTSQVFGIDRRGNFRLLWGSDVTAEQIAEDIQKLLKL